MLVCSNCGRLLVGVGDYCPYCGFPRPKLTQQLEDTGAIPRVRPSKRTPGLKKVGKRTLAIVVSLVGIVGLVVGGLYLFRPSSAVGDPDVARGTVPDQLSPLTAAWSKARSEIFTGLGAISSVRFYEPGRYDSAYASTIVAAASDATGRSQLVSLNAVDGSVRWRVSAATPFSCADRPISGGLACLYDSQLRLVVLADGAVGRTLPVHVTSKQVAVVGDVVLALSGQNTSKTESRVNLQAFAIDGDLLWSDEVTAAGTSYSLSTSGGVVAVTGVVRADDGTPIVHTVADGATLALPAGTVTLLPNERIAVTADDATTICTTAGACDVRVDGRPVLPTVFDSGLEDYPLLFSASGGDVNELRVYTSSGVQTWSRAVSDPTVVGFCAGKLVLRDKAAVTVVSPSDGAQAWSQTAIPESTAMWCDTARVMTFTADAGLSAFEIENGRQAWTVDFGASGRPSLVATTGGFLAVGDTWVRYG